MKNLKKQLKDYLERNGKEEHTSYRELYNIFPFDGNDLSNKQKGDRVRSIWKKMKKQNPQGTQQANCFSEHGHRSAERLIVSDKYDPLDVEWVTTTSDVSVIKDKFDLPERKIERVFIDPQMGVVELPEVVMEKKNEAKILIFDLETSPLKSYVWSLWKQNVHPTNGQLQSQRMILSWSAKWLYEEEVLFDHMLPNEIKEEDDSNVTKSLWKLIDEADIVIAHNGNGFDVKIMNTRFLLHGLNPPTHYQTIDTLLHARKRFKLESNKLDYIGQILGLGKKHDTGGFQLWVDCMNGSTTAMTKMVEYCNQDVKLLEAVYLRMRSWIKPHPAVNLITDNFDELTCPTCNSSDIKDYGTYTTYASTYPAHKCNSCHSTFRSRDTKKIDKSKLTISTPN